MSRPAVLLFLAMALPWAGDARSGPRTAGAAEPSAPAAAAAATRWHGLLAAGDDATARAECAILATSTDPLTAAEGEACLANVELRQAGGLDLRASAEGRAPEGHPDPEKVDRALAHLRRALALTPSNAALHHGVFDVLFAAGRFAEMRDALGQALAAHPGGELDQWLRVPADLFTAGAADDALAAARLLEARWPDDARIVGTIGSLLSVLERDDEALRYLQRAVALAPTDPVERWNLSRLLEIMGRDDEAAASYARWSELETDPERLMRQTCTYSRFIEQRRGDLPRACRLQEVACPPASRTACAALAARQAAGAEGTVNGAEPSR